MTLALQPAERHDLRVHAAARPHHPAIVCDRATLTYAQLEALANQLAHTLRGLGLQRGDHIASLLGNGPEALALAWASYRSGLYLTPMSTALTAAELRYLIDNSDARAVFVEAAFADTARHLPTGDATPRRWLAINGDIPGFAPLNALLRDAPSTPAEHEPPGALMVYTSGTTGAPKGVIRPLLPADYAGTPPFAADLLTLFPIGGADVRYLSTAPLYHAAPLRFALAVTAGGGTVHVMSRFDAEDALQILARERITHSQWVPAMFQRLLALPAEQRQRFHAPDHRWAVHAAAPCPAPVKRAMIDWWGPILSEYYSGSEGVGLTTLDSRQWLAHPGSVGLTVKGVLHIVDDAGHEVPTGTTGLVCFSGISPFAYYKAPEKTAARTHPLGWQTFGDIGHVDADGFLYLTDRQDDMIISGGVNVYPQEIEQALMALHGVLDCAVVGVPDERFGERPEAFVSLQAEAFGDDWQAALQQHCEQQLGRIKRPAAFHRLAEVPRSPTGKVLRRVLRDTLAIDAA